VGAVNRSGGTPGTVKSCTPMTHSERPARKPPYVRTSHNCGCYSAGRYTILL
jgi:hypothetical protein